MDYTGLLTEISRSLRQIADAPNYTWIAPIATLASGALGWWASQRTIKHHHAKATSDNEARRTLVYKLLTDEITLRWKGEIEPYIRGRLKYEPLEALDGFSVMALGGGDVFALKSISESFHDYFFLKNDILVSEIVHAYLLVCDLADFRALTEKVLAERKAVKRELEASFSEEEVAKRLAASYGDIIQDRYVRLGGKLDAIDERLSGILRRIKHG